MPAPTSERAIVEAGCSRGLIASWQADPKASASGLSLACTKPRNGSWDDAAAWHLLPNPPPMSCLGRSAFVSIVSGEKAIDQVECLHRQLNRWQQTCPLLVFHNDHDEGNRLPARAVQRLQAVLGKRHVRPSSWLLARANITVQSVSPTSRPSTGSVTQAPGTPLVGRRLLQRAGSYLVWGTITKVCMFLLHYERLVFLDLDLVLLQPLDALLALPMPKTTFLASTGVGPACGQVVPWEPFNGGLVVFRPSRRMFERLMLRLCLWFSQPKHESQAIYEAVFGSSCATWSAGVPLPRIHGFQKRLIKVCEKRLTDQSLFNWEFRGKYVALPYSYNAQPTRWKRPPPVNASALAVLHFIGDPKPWTQDGVSEKQHPWHASASRLWAEACAIQTGPAALQNHVRLQRLAAATLQDWRAKS